MVRDALRILYQSCVGYDERGYFLYTLIVIIAIEQLYDQGPKFASCEQDQTESGSCARSRLPCNKQTITKNRLKTKKHFYVFKYSETCYVLKYSDTYLKKEINIVRFHTGQITHF